MIDSYQSFLCVLTQLQYTSSSCIRVIDQIEFEIMSVAHHTLLIYLIYHGCLGIGRS